MKPFLKSIEDIIPLDEKSEPRNNQDDKLIEDATRKNSGMLFPWFMRWRQAMRPSIGMAVWDQWIQNKYRNQPTRFLHWVASFLSLSIFLCGIIIFWWQGSHYKKLLRNEEIHLMKMFKHDFHSIWEIMENLDMGVDYLIKEMEDDYKNIPGAKGIKFTLILAETPEWKGLSTPEKVSRFIQRSGTTLSSGEEESLGHLQKLHKEEDYLNKMESWKKTISPENYQRQLAEFEKSFTKEEISFPDRSAGMFYNRKENDVLEMAIVGNRDGICSRCHGYSGGESLIFLTSVSLKEYASEKYDVIQKAIILIATGILILGICGPLITGYLTLPIIKDLQSKEKEIDKQLQDLEEAYAKVTSYAAEKEMLSNELHLYTNKIEQLAEERSRQLVRADRLASLGTMAAGVAHEINNPNTAIKANAETLLLYWPYLKKGLEKMLADKEGDNPRLLMIMEDFPTVTKDVLESVNRVQEIVDGLKDFSRIKETSFQEEDIVDILQNALKFSKLDPFLNHNVSIQTQFESNLPKFHINKQEIEQVFVNLFTNAAHALEVAHDGTKNPVLKITAMREESEVRIMVADNGTGMSAEVKEKIFNPFFTTKHDAGKGSRGRGTGLGLSICHGIIDKHRGSITVESEPGAGSVFTVSLPIDPLNKDRRRQEGRIAGGMRAEDR